MGKWVQARKLVWPENRYNSAGSGKWLLDRYAWRPWPTLATWMKNALVVCLLYSIPGGRQVICLYRIQVQTTNFISQLTIKLVANNSLSTEYLAHYLQATDTLATNLGLLLVVLLFACHSSANKPRHYISRYLGDPH